MADLGAGSAVLAIAAAKLGAAYVAAIELDPDAIGNAEENVARNGVGDRVTVIEGDAAMLLAARRAGAGDHGEHHLVGARSSCFRRSRSCLPDDGRAILSGMLCHERRD